MTRSIPPATCLLAWIVACGGGGETAPPDADAPDGDAAACEAAEACPGQPPLCRQWSCVDGRCAAASVPSGDLCEGGVCDGAGSCVE